MTMNQTADPVRPDPVIVTRHFAAPPGLLFRAWSSATHLKQWFSPAGYSVPEAEVDPRPGGVFALCMRGPDGKETWTRGIFVEVKTPTRLSFTATIGTGGETGFTARTTVTFAAEANGTLLTVRQDYEVFDPAFLAAVAGAPDGWRTTLDKLAAELDRMQTPAVHGSFSIERVYAAAPPKVFHALTDPAAKARWFVGGAEQTILERVMEARPGGRERVRGRWASGTVTCFDAVYFDVVTDQRLVYAYEMHLDERKISVSLATVELFPVAAGTRIKVTEQGAFLNGYQDNGAREHGTGLLLDQLGAFLA
jgi:uncharacterized protein YndB with AHSA1/START domain